MEIPKHWKKVPLRELVIIQKGMKPKKQSSKKFENSIPYLDIDAIERGNITQYADYYSSTHSTEGDIFVLRTGGRNGLILKGKNGAVGSTLFCLTPILIDKSYLYYFLKSNEFSHSGTRDLYNSFWDLQVPLPPLEEQKRIVETLETKLNEYQKDFDNAKNELTKMVDYRESILEEAITGSLIKKGIKDSIQIQNEKFVKFENFDFPNSWQLLSSSQVFEFITSGSREWSKYYSKKGALFIRIGNLNRNSIELNLSPEKLVYVKLPDNIEGVRTRLQPDDILISITGEIGLIGLVDKNIGEAYVNQHIALVRPRQEYNSRFLCLILLSNFGKKQLNDKKSGTTRAGLGLTDINNLILPIPPAKDQVEIVAHVERLLGEANEMEIKSTHAMKLIEALKQSVLHMAFQGQFSSSESKDESVLMLLERIKIEKEKVEKEHKEVQKLMSKIRIQMNEKIDKDKSILQILKTADNQTLTVEELWHETVFSKTNEVEPFYEELFKLEKTEKVEVSWVDNKKKITTNITLTKNAN